MVLGSIRNLSEKKLSFLVESIEFSIDYVEKYIRKYSSYFRSHRFNNTQTAVNCVLGLLKCPKGEANMERMEEEIDNSEYRAYQQFIANSNWNCDGLLKAIAQDASALLWAQQQQNGLPTGYIIDESGHLKKWIESLKM